MRRGRSVFVQPIRPIIWPILPRLTPTPSLLALRSAASHHAWRDGAAMPLVAIVRAAGARAHRSHTIPLSSLVLVPWRELPQRFLVREVVVPLGPVRPSKRRRGRALCPPPPRHGRLRLYHRIVVVIERRGRSPLVRRKVRPYAAPRTGGGITLPALPRPPSGRGRSHIGRGRCLLLRGCTAAGCTARSGRRVVQPKEGIRVVGRRWQGRGSGQARH